MKSAAIEKRLDKMRDGLTTTINDVPVTKWGKDCYEVNRIDGKHLVSREDAVKLIATN